jgi:hypothetical protein
MLMCRLHNVNLYWPKFIKTLNLIVKDLSCGFNCRHASEDMQDLSF